MHVSPVVQQLPYMVSHPLRIANRLLKLRDYEPVSASRMTSALIEKAFKNKAA